jgi:hypothetical protein
MDNILKILPPELACIVLEYDDGVATTEMCPTPEDVGDLERIVKKRVTSFRCATCDMLRLSAQFDHVHGVCDECWQKKPRLGGGSHEKVCAPLQPDERPFYECGRCKAPHRTLETMKVHSIEGADDECFITCKGPCSYKCVRCVASLSFGNRRHRKMIHIITTDYMDHDAYLGLLCSGCYRRADKHDSIRRLITAQGTRCFGPQIDGLQAKSRLPKPSAEDTLEEYSALIS